MTTVLAPPANAQPVHFSSAPAPESQQPEAAKPTVTKDDDIIAYLVELVNDGLTISRENKFAPVIFTYEQLELMKKVLAATLVRGRQLEQVIEMVNSRHKQLTDTLETVKLALPRVDVK